MQIFLFSASVDSARLNDLEHRIRAKLPDVRIVNRMEEVTKALPKTAGSDGELACILLKTAKRTRARRVCLLDLDFQNSHVCDYLDIEPRMQIHEIAANPERLDAQLFDLFVSHHTSGLDVLAAPRSRDHAPDIDPH